MHSFQWAGQLALLVSACAMAQAETAEEPSAEKRAQKQADQVFTWIRAHGQPERVPLPSAGKKTPAARDAMLEAIETPDAVLPADFQAEVASGHVQVRFTVDPAGRVSSAEALKSTHPKLAQPAVNAVLRWKFKPIPHAQQGIADLDFRAPRR